jgi:hypothetical protein
MEFHVVHFNYDGQLTVVAADRVKTVSESDSDVPIMIRPGTECSVSFKTETLTDDGRTAIVYQPYNGTVVCTSLGKYTC